ncbi:hypothetical protein C8R45DRAFT_751956, partial [Mycena sanguinolenta]
QLPLNPAYAFTSHNSQGRTLEKSCLDLASCGSIQSAYVMLLRLKSLKGLCIATFQTGCNSEPHITR